jgi:hypothetical protein
MAHIVPSDISRLALSGGSRHELDTLQQLKTDLPNDYTVFHGVHWSREYEAWTHFGEIDFVVLNRAGKVLFIEQKNGALEETGSGLVKHYDDGDKDIAHQLQRSINKVREKFQWTHGKQTNLAVDYLFYCPNYRIKNLNAAGLSASRIVDATVRDGLADHIQTLLEPGKSANDGWLEKVEEFFYQTFELVPDIHTHIGSQEKHFVHQSGALAEILTNLEMEPYRLKVAGTAGSGKSLFARRFLDQEAGKGRKVLLVCFNRPLADRIRQSVGDAGQVNTFMGFCDDFLKSRGLKLDYSDMNGNPDFWRNVQEQVMDQEVPDDWKFDSLIVDEGQDFEAEWFEILRLFLRTGANILWLEDSDQNIYGKPPVPLEGFVRFRSAVNYRSPESIAGFIAKTLSIPFEQGNHLPGLGVDVHGYDEAEEQPKIVGKIVQNLMRQGFTHDDIVVLTCRGVKNSVFSDLDKVGGLGLRYFSGDYDSDGNQLWSEGRLTFDSIYRFKGQEAPAVILVDVDPNTEDLDRAEQLLYCGMTRATVRLDLVVYGENSYNQRFLQDGD